MPMELDFFDTHYITVEPPVSDHPKCHAQVLAYERLSLTRVQTIMAQNVSSLEYGNCC